MTESLEWDWPPTKRYHKRRRDRVEVLPPKQDEEEPRPQRLEIIAAIDHQLAYAACRRCGRAISLAIQLRAVIIGVIAWKLVAAMLMIAAVVAVAPWRERRYG